MREPLLVAAASFALVALFTYVPYLAPVLAPFSAVLIAAAFLYLPVFVLGRRRQGLEAIGVGWRPGRRGTVTLLVVCGTVFPAFCAGFFLYHNLLFDRSMCLEVDRLAAWSDALATLSPAGVADPEGLVVGKTDAEALFLRNTGAVARRVEVRWSPPGMVPHKLSGRGHPPRLVRMGAVTLKPGQRLQFSPVPGPAQVRILGAGPLHEASGEQQDLPYSASKDWWWILSFFWVQLILVALPEEVFYRGYLQTRLTAFFKRRWTVFGGDVGPAVLTTSALFALGHLIAIPAAGRLAVFFPSILFGWLRDRTGSVAVCILLHALSNLLLAVLQKLLC